VVALEHIVVDDMWSYMRGNYQEAAERFTIMCFRIFKLTRENNHTNENATGG
jgi:hypothetical protein